MITNKRFGRRMSLRRYAALRGEDYNNLIHGGLVDLVALKNKYLPGEWHVPLIDKDGKFRKASFLGPGTNLSARLENFDPTTGTFDSILTPPVDELDAAAMEHDIAYAMHKDLESRHKADMVLYDKATQIANSTTSLYQKAMAHLVRAIMLAKVKVGGRYIRPEDIDDTIYYGGNINRVLEILEMQGLIEPRPRNPSSVMDTISARLNHVDTVGGDLSYLTNPPAQTGRASWDVNTLEGAENVRGLVAGLATIALVAGVPAVISLVKKLREKK